MAWQLIYTSAPRTLTPGQTGYGTVARSADLREGLAQRLEQLSYFDHSPSQDGVPEPVFAFRILDFRGTRFYLLTRCIDAGLDFTQRTNHLAHHLVFSPDELPSLPSPAILFSQWGGWKDRWDEEPRLLENLSERDFADLPRSVGLPAAEWSRQAGSASMASALLSGEALSGIWLATFPSPPSAPKWLALFAESGELLDPQGTSPQKRWEATFTTCFQDQDQPGDFRWRVVEPGSANGQRWNATPLTPGALPTVPGPLADLASTGLRVGSRRDVAPKSATQAATDDWLSSTSGKQTPGAPSVPPLTKPIPTAWEDAPHLDPAEPSRPSRSRIPAVTVSLFVAVLLITGFWRPGWLREQPSPPELANTQMPWVPPKNGPGPNAPLPASTAPMPQAPAPAAGPEPGDIETVNASIDSIPTYVLLARAQQMVRTEEIPELLGLMSNIFRAQPPLTEPGIEIAVARESVYFSNLGQTNAAVRITYLPQRTLEATAGEARWRADATPWFQDPTRPIQLDYLNPRGHPLTATIRPLDGVAFPGFRLVFVSTNPLPILLGKSLLIEGQPTLDASLSAPLKQRLEGIKLPGAFAWQLRPLTGNPLTDIYGAIGNDAPPRGRELDFAAIHQRLTEQLNNLSERLKTNQQRVTRLQSNLNKQLETDISLGAQLGWGDEGDLKSYKSHLKKVGQPASRTSFVQYVQRVTSGRLPDALASRILDPGSAVQLFTNLAVTLKNRGYGKALEGVPDDYFIRKWERLGDADEVTKLQKVLREIQQEQGERTAQANRIPRDLQGATAVGLFMVHSNSPQRIELIRFIDSSKPKSP